MVKAQRCYIICRNYLLINSFPMLSIYRIIHRLEMYKKWSCLKSIGIHIRCSFNNYYRQNILLSFINILSRRRKGVYGPSMGKKIILAFDDFETSVNSRSTEKVVELLRLLLERKFWYDLEDSCRIELIDFVSMRMH